MSRLSDYLYAKAYQRVEGWLMDGAAWATYFVAEWQKAHGIVGDVAEIGVHHGKYFTLLSLLSDDNEKAVAIDVFDQQDLNVDRSGKGDFERFQGNFKNFDGRPNKLIVHSVDSLQLAQCDLLKPDCPKQVVLNRSFRIFSVDGSHTAQHTANDIEVAFGVLRPRGVVIVDDFYNPHWPGVQEGVHGLLTRRRDITAVAFGDNKLFLVRSEDHQTYLRLFGEHMSEFFADIKDVKLHDRAAVCFAIRNPRDLFDVDLRRINWITSFGRERGKMPRAVQLSQGWAAPETQGTWVTEPVAIAKIRVPAEIAQQGCPVDVSIYMHPYVHDQRKTRAVSLKTSLGDSMQNNIHLDTIFKFRVTDPSRHPEVTLTIAADTPDVPALISSEISDHRALSLFVSRVIFSLTKQNSLGGA